ncbi:Hydroxyacylglutathione hydrolase [Trichinella spiralis]|uniref:Hydroxyacylglutathione hydrolase n=1 Tax=Trichinella spiralis TaxID=6334 RepID=A0ABR3KFK7_TRISP
MTSRCDSNPAQLDARKRLGFAAIRRSHYQTTVAGSMGLLRRSNFLKSVEFNETANNSTANDSIRINRSTAVRMSNILQTTKIPVQVS